MLLRRNKSHHREFSGLGRKFQAKAKPYNAATFLEKDGKPMFILFRDRDPWFKTDYSGYNKSGYIAKNGTVVHPLRKKLVVSPLTKIKKYHHQLLPYSSSVDPQELERYFTQNVANQDLFFRGLLAVHEDDHIFFENPIRLPILSPISTEEFERKWEIIGSILQAGDFVFTFDTSSFVSKIIAHVDQGTWSHVAVYVGAGNICEAITKGVVERSITSYQSHRFRLGVYRPYQRLGSEYLNVLRRQIGKPYNYRGVITLGLKKILGIRKIDGNPKNISPNDLAGLGEMKLVFLI